MKDRSPSTPAVVVCAAGGESFGCPDPSQILYYVTTTTPRSPVSTLSSFQAAERRFASRADVILASAPELVTRMRTLNENVLYAPSVTDYALFAKALDEGPVDPVLASLPRPRMLFIGAILAATIDIELMVRLAGCDQIGLLPSSDQSARGPRTNIDALSGLQHPSPWIASHEHLPRFCAEPTPRSFPTAGRSDAQRLPDEDL